MEELQGMAMAHRWSVGNFKVCKDLGPRPGWPGSLT